MKNMKFMKAPKKTIVDACLDEADQTHQP